MKYITPAWITLMMCVASQPVGAQNTLDLSGNWSFQLDDTRVGERERWFEKDLKHSILLPGSTDERGFGVKAGKPQETRLTREHRHVGPAWYQKMIEIPKSWQGRRVELFLERVMWETKVWLDDYSIGMADSLCVPHRFDLSDYVTSGKHHLTLRIDNRLKINVGMEPSRGGGGWSRMWAMSLTEESQTNWNGVIGRIELRVTEPVWIERVETYSDVRRGETRVVAFVRSRIGVASGKVTVSATCGGHSMGPVTAAFRTKGANEAAHTDPLAPLMSDLSGSYLARRALTRVELRLPFGNGARLWDEFSPCVYQLTARLSAQASGKTYQGKYRDTFGLREFQADGRRFKLNGRTVFLRGNQDNCIHPKTGYPPMDKAAWLAFLQKHKDYGLNCMRFHSWCPPKAAFEAADELGMFVHVETPLWDGSGGGGIGNLPERAAFIRYEAERILDEYGNHPSFCMMSVGNELGHGKELYLQHLVQVLRSRDRRRLYTCTSHPADPARNDDFFVGAAGIGGPARGFIAGGQPNSDRFNTDTNYQTIKGFERPFVSHEIGQHTSFPDFYCWFNEDKYTGPLKARYIGLLKEKFERFHPPERGSAFAKASGKLQLLLYKGEIETMLRTPELDGFHLNGLVDYPGEGIALIGMLDAMGDSKGIVTPEGFRRFCSETVPLARFKKWNWSPGDTLEVTAQVRHHGPKDLNGRQWLWSVTAPAGKVLLKGDLGTHRVATGELTDLGVIKVKLPQVTKPQELTLELRMASSEVANSWHFWVYSTIGALDTPAGVLVADAWTGAVKKTLESGGRVLLIPGRETVRQTVDVHFWTIFWGRGLFPHTLRPLGIFCDPTNPALAAFPTREHSDWQWIDLMTGAYAMNLNTLPFEFEPVVHVIDDFNVSHRLAMVMEARVGNGRLLVSTLNLGLKGRRTLPQQQMLKSLLDRAAAHDFRPMHALSIEQVDGLFKPPTSTLWQEKQGAHAARPGDPLFVERFQGLEGGGSGRQPGTKHPLKHSARLRGWTAYGFNSIHAVQRSDETWALQVLAAGIGNNILTLNNGIRANENGRHYTVTFEAGPTVYQDPGQATLKDDNVMIELLRLDGSVLKKLVVTPGAWTGRETFTKHTFSYEGDGSGDLRFRISPVSTGDTRFTGAISHLRVFRAGEEAPAGE